MRIQTNVAANTAYRNLSVTNGMLQKSVQRLSSGFRINRSGDDVAGLAIANELRNEGRGLAAAQRNATQAAAVLDIADGSLGQITQIIDRMRELATVAGSANSSDADRQNLDSEFQALLSEIDRIADETTYQGQSLFGFNGDFRVGTGTGAVINVSISGLTATDLTVGGLDILSAGGATAVLSAITASGGALDVIADVSGEIGAAQNRLEYAAATLAVRIENVAAAESVIRDLDVAQETTRFTKFQILQQAGTAMLAQANSTPQAVLSLLRG